MLVVIVVSGENGVAHSGRHRLGEAGVLHIGIVIIAGAIVELHVHRHRPVGQVFEGDDVALRIGADNEALHLDGGIVGHAVVLYRCGRFLGDALGFHADGNRLRLHDLRGRALDDILHRVGGGSGHGVDEGDHIVCRIQLQVSELLRRICAVAHDAGRGLGDLLTKHKGGIGHGLRLCDLFAVHVLIPHGIGEGLHRPVGIEGHIIHDGLVRVEAHAALFLREPAEEGIALTFRIGNLRNLALFDDEGLGLVVVIVNQFNVLIRRRELGVEHQIVGGHGFEDKLVRALRIDIPAAEDVVRIQIHVRRLVDKIEVRSVDVLLEADTGLGGQLRRSIVVVDLIGIACVVEVVIRYTVFRFFFFACIFEAFNFLSAESTRCIGFLTVLLRIRILVILCVLQHVVEDDLRAALPDSFKRGRGSVRSGLEHLRREIEALGNILRIRMFRIPAVEGGRCAGDVGGSGPLGGDVLAELRSEAVLGTCVLLPTNRQLRAILVDVEFQRIGVQHILRLHNRGAIRLDFGRGGSTAVIVVVFAVRKAACAVRAGDRGTDGCRLHRGADVIKSACIVFLEIDHGVVHRIGDPLGVDRRVLPHALDGGGSYLGASRIRIPAAEGVALTGGDGRNGAGGRSVIAGGIMGMLSLAAGQNPAI